MTLRKLAGLLAAFGLTLGLIGGGVGASFIDSVTGTENIDVGTFGCQIISGDGDIANVPHTGSTITYTAPTILSSAADSAPFSFVVQNVGTIPMALSVSGPSWTGSLDGSFSGIAPTLSAATLAYLDTSTVSTGIQWGILENGDLGASGSATWTVNCDEVPAPAPVTIVHTQIGIAGTGWYGWSCPAGSTIVSGSVDTALVVDGPAKLGSTVDGVNYPIFPHYTYPAGEEGWVVHNNGGPTTQVLTIVCQP